MVYFWLAILTHKMKQKKRMLLLYPGEFYSPTWGRSIKIKPHMVYVYSFLKKLFNPYVIDLENEFSRPRNNTELKLFKRRALKMILSIATDYVGISCWSSLNYLSAKYFAEAIKEKNPNVKIIVGGYHPTFVPQDFRYKNSPFDYVIRGEIHNISRVLNIRGSIEGINRIKPDFLAYPYFNNQKSIGIFLSTGCPFNCRYCMEYRKKWSAYDANDAVNLIAGLDEELSPNYIQIYDACFGINRKWRKKFLLGLVQNKVNCYLWVQTRPDLIDLEDLELISKLKFKLDFGIDSFSKTMLRIMDKTPNPDFYLRKFILLSRKCSELKIMHDAYLIFNHPGESKKTYREYREFFEKEIIKKLKGGYLRIRHQNFFFFPGSYVFNHINYFVTKYSTTVLSPHWWREEYNHRELASAVMPSRDKRGNFFFVSRQEVGELIDNFNKTSLENDLWQKLFNFNFE